MLKTEYVAIVALLDRSLTHKVLDILKEKHGITKSTIILARGDSENYGVFFGIRIQPERECFISLVESSKSEEVLLTIEEEGRLKTPGHGVAFSLDVNQIAGLL